ncbi:ferredoxin [Rhodococcus sp. ABRD24]|uniref:ferredoxin n=1 Tax=Rhodococcus sp. ABRD24 TaxID=2507582 RepID=UPI001040B10B|nr:ferredoxin [Rhodococcus sp. ABRD24]QBJ97193.1 ferredoxin [Rhodococcus sp. ABRD24]
MTAHVHVDTARCQGHARCFAFAPKVFDLDDEGYSFVLEGHREVPTVSAELRLAEANCPERAVIVKED